jgi:Skp family chaperone for outer membrane proteins
MIKQRIAVKWLLSCFFVFQALSTHSKDAQPLQEKDLVTNKAATKVVMYSNQRIMTGITQVKVEEARLKELEDKSRENLKALNDEFMTTAEALNNKDTLTEKAKKELEEKLQRLYQEMGLANQEFEELARRQAMESQMKVEKALNEAVEQFSKANSDLAILDTNHRFINEKADITDEIIKIMNTNFEVELAKEAAAKKASAKEEKK